MGLSLHLLLLRSELMAEVAIAQMETDRDLTR
jgi:hypothetical protein